MTNHKHIQFYHSALAENKRRSLELSVDQLAFKIGAKPAAVRSWERGKTTPKSIKHRLNLVRVLGVNWKSLFPRQDRKKVLAMDMARKAKKAGKVLSKALSSEIATIDNTFYEPTQYLSYNRSTGAIQSIKECIFALEQLEKSVKKALDVLR